MKRALKTGIKRLWQRGFTLLQRVGINVVPEHFYSGIPNIADLERRSDWRRPRTMHGIAVNAPDRQIALLDAMITPNAEPLHKGSILAESIVGGGADGPPSARIVLCKDIVLPQGYLLFFSNYESRKGAELAHHPRAAAVPGLRPLPIPLRPGRGGEPGAAEGLNRGATCPAG